MNRLSDEAQEMAEIEKQSNRLLDDPPTAVSAMGGRGPVVIEPPKWKYNKYEWADLHGEP